ncbi:hypothetical protein RvY_02201 [Ramazzottius varieornatus]|uniref:Uncharacterized protein n=1 Tax=Ramazzottius varieornatus TaxID=947166 RepID=A0A1D1UPV0_RAMVA|nr:hypothetical protein RvY_02201 [Ramazzottius varieornatus]
MGGVSDCGQTTPRESERPHLTLGFQSIANIDMNDDTWRQASLPVANGGLRLRCAAELTLPAYLASVHAAHHLVSQIVLEADVDGVTAEGITL